MRLFAVAGRPVLHSRSPLIFNTLFKTHAFPGTYTRLAAGDAGEAIFLFRELGLSGLNVTAPFKEEIMPFLDALDPAASSIGAVNTVVREGKELKGYNSDHSGVVAALKKSGVGISGKHCVVLGAGGAGRAAAFGLLGEGGRVTLANRTPDKAARAARALGCRSAGLDKLPTLLRDSDILVSAISAEMTPVKPAWLHKNIVVLDAQYPDSSLIKMAEKKGCLAVKGEEWLMNQAVPVWRLFTGLDTEGKSLAAALSPAWPPARKRANIALIGFMGSGKTALGKSLAFKIGWAFRDTDALIEQMAGASIKEIFEAKGEAEFRGLEKALLRALSKENRFVYSCGGGSVMDAQNRRLLSENALVVWLYASLKTSLKRLDIGTRPLLQGPNPRKKAKDLLTSRLPCYAQTADLVVSTERDLDRAVDGIYEEIRQILPH